MTLKCIFNGLSAAHLWTIRVTSLQVQPQAFRNHGLLRQITAEVALFSPNTGFAPSTSVLAEGKSFPSNSLPLGCSTL